MRDILTGLAIVLILILTGALVGPYFIDWNAHRSGIEDEMSRRLGIPVRIRGDIAVRFLPAPRVSLGQVEFKDHGAERPMFAVDSVHIEVAPAPLMRGEFRVVEAAVEGPRLALDTLQEHAGGARLGAFVARIAPDALAIDRLIVRDALILPGEDSAATGAVARLSGEFVAATIAGPWRGAGEVTVADRRLGFQLSTGVADAGIGVRLKLALEDAAASARAEFEGLARLSGNRSAPVEIEGRLVATGLTSAVGGQFPAGPWKVTASGASSGLAFAATKLELEAGPEGLVKLEGTGRLDLARGARLAIALAAAQVDLDRIEGAGANGAPASPTHVATALATLPFDLELRLDLERIIAKGEAHGPLSVSLKSGRGRLQLDQLTIELAAQTRLTAQADILFGDRLVAQGEMRLTSADPGRAGIALLQLKSADPIAAALRSAGPTSIAGKFLVDAEGVSLTAADIRFGDTRIGGEARLRPASGRNRARLDARLEASQLDLDLVSLVMPEANTPLDVTLALEAASARASVFGGRDLGRLSVRLRTAARLLDIERLELDGQGVAKVAVFGRLEDRSGRMTAEVDTAKLGAVIDVLRPILPATVIAGLASRAETLSPARFAATFESRADQGEALRLFGVLGGTRVDGHVELAPAKGGDAMFSIDRARLSLEAADGRAFLRQFGVTTRDSAPIGRGEARFEIAAEGVQRGWTLEASLGELTLSGKGRLASGEAAMDPSGGVSLRATDLRRLLAAIGWPIGPDASPIGVEAGATVALAPRGLAFSKIDGRMGGRPFGGALTAAVASDGGMRLTGELGLERLALADLVHAIAPGQFPGLAGRGLSAARFPAFRPLPLALDLAIGAGRLDIASGVAATRARLALKSDALGFEIVDGSAEFAKGRLAVQARLRRDGDRFAANGRLHLVGVDLASILPRGLAEGRADVRLDLAATGESEAALLANAGGGGELAVTDLALVALDPAGLRRAILSVNPDGEAPKAEAFLDRLSRELAARAFPVPTATVPVVLSGGTLRVGPLAATEGETALQASFSAALAAGSLDGRIALTATGAIPEWSGAPPSITVSLGGTMATPVREIDAATVINSMIVRAVQREMARIEAMEADQRERSAQNRLLRGFREMDQREQELRQFIEEQERESAQIARIREATQAFTRAIEAEERAKARITRPLHDPEGIASELHQFAPAPPSQGRTVTLPLPPPAPPADAPVRRRSSDRRTPTDLPQVTSPNAPAQLLPIPGLRPQLNPPPLVDSNR